MSKKKKDEEFKPTVIEPIEGQMCYDELLVPQKEEEKPVEQMKLDGQIDIWALAEEKSSISTTESKSKKSASETT